MSNAHLDGYLSELFDMHCIRLQEPDNAIVIWVDSSSAFEEKHIRAFVREQGRVLVKRGPLVHRQRPAGAALKVVAGRRYTFATEEVANLFEQMLAGIPRRRIVIPLSSDSIEPDFLRRHFGGRNTALHHGNGETYFTGEAGLSELSIVMLKLSHG